MSKHNQPHNNPHASAASAYGTNAQKNSEDPREVEARVLLKSAQFMQTLQANWDTKTSDDLHDTLKYNRNIWMMFYDTAIESTDSTLPKELRNNIYNLSNFIFKREVEILANPQKQKLDILISINRDIAAGLMTGITNDAKNNTAAKPDEKKTDETAKPPSGGWSSSA